MKTGNPKVAGALICLVLIAIVFDAASYVAHQHRPVPQVAPVAKATANVESPQSSLPTKVTGNPFFHPALLLRPISSVSRTLPPLSTPHRGGQEFLPIGTATVPWTTQEEPRAHSGLTVVPTRSGSVPKTHTFQIGATVDSTSPVALISIDGGSSKSYRPGDSLANGIRVGRISEDLVAIIASGATFTLHVGEKLQK